MDTPPRPHPAKAPAPALGSATLFLLLAASFVATFLLIRTYTAKSAPGRAADYSWRVTDMDGKPVDLERYRDRPVFLNVWATWCPPCRAEMPAIARLASNPKLKDVAFLCISGDESLAEVQAYFSGVKPPMTILHSPGPIPPVFDTGAFPTTFFIAPGGKITRVETGDPGWDGPEFVAILEALDGKAG